MSTVCRQCRSSLQNNTIQPQRRRQFGTSPASRSQIPPESPRYIYVPESKQPESFNKKWIKGILPIPRKAIHPVDLMSRRKVSAEYLAAVTPEPQQAPAIPNPQTYSLDQGFTSYKARQSALRRQNLRQGLVELQDRQSRTRQSLLDRARERQKRNITLRDAPEREDERLTSPTVLSSSSSSSKASDTDSQTEIHNGLPDPGRAARLALKRHNVNIIQSLRSEERRDMLHTLYVYAGDFITTDAQLEESLTRAFDDTTQFKNDIGPGMNIWNLGPPETTRQLLERSGKRAEALKGVSAGDANMRVTKERIKRISEELTGGKMLDLKKTPGQTA